MKLLKLTFIILLASFIFISFQASVYGRSFLLSETIDQSQERESGGEWFDKIAWQEFVPQIKKLIRIDLKIMAGGGEQSPIRLYIEQPLGSIIASKELTASSIPIAAPDWVTFDINDVTLNPRESYYIKLSFSPGSQYYWCGSGNNPYPNGISSKGETWDWCFRTIVDKSRINRPVIFFEQIGLKRILDML